MLTQQNYGSDVPSCGTRRNFFLKITHFFEFFYDHLNKPMSTNKQKNASTTELINITCLLVQITPLTRVISWSEVV